MKVTMLRATLLVAMAVGLASCGGKAKFDVGGVIEGLKYPGLVLTNGGAELAVNPPATSFRFPNQIEYGEVYNVKIKTAGTPAVDVNPAHQTCQVLNPTDTAGRQASINIVIRCVTNAYPLGGKVSGLTADGLVLINGSNYQYTVPKDATSWAFPSAIEYGSAYGVSVLTQPTSGQLFCSVSNPIGEMGDAAITNVDVSCVPRIGG